MAPKSTQSSSLTAERLSLPEHLPSPDMFDFDGRLGADDAVEKKTRWNRVWKENKGMIFVLVGEVFGSGMAATTRLLETSGVDGNEGMDTLHILFARFSVTFVLSTIYMYFAKTPHFPWGAKEVRHLLWGRGLFGFCGAYGFYYSLKYLSLAEGVLLGFIAPLATAFATSLFLKVPFARKQLFAALIAFIGVSIIADPFSLYTSHDDASQPIQVPKSQRLLAIGVGLISVFAATGAYTTIRLIGDRAHALIQVNYYALFTTMSSGFLLAAPITFPNGGQIPNFKLPDGRTEWMLLGYIGCCGFMLQVLMTAGLQADSSAKATNMMYSQIIFAMILDWLIWGHVPGWGTMIGGCIVLGGVVWGTLQKVEAPRIKDEEYAMVNSVDRELMLEDDDEDEEEEEEEDDDDETETVVAGRKEDDDL